MGPIGPPQTRVLGQRTKAEGCGQRIKAEGWHCKVMVGCKQVIGVVRKQVTGVVCRQRIWVVWQTIKRDGWQLMGRVGRQVMVAVAQTTKRVATGLGQARSIAALASTQPKP